MSMYLPICVRMYWYLRSRMRARNLPFDPMSLAIGLGRYSERGDNYVNEVQRIILQNDLRKRDREIDI